MDTSVEKTWFFGWLSRHQGWNRGPGWKCYESEGPVVYLPWIEAFDRERVTEDEADRASRRLAAEEHRFPEHHLHRLLALAREGRAEQAAMSSTPGSTLAALREEVAASEANEAPLREAWERLDAHTRGSYLNRARVTCPGLPGKLLKAIARVAWGEDQGIVPRVSGVSMLDYWQQSQTRAAPAPGTVPAEAVPLAPPALPAEREADLTAHAAENRHEQLARLGELKAALSRAS